VAEARETSPAQVALAWLLSVPGVVAPIVGATRTEQLADAVGALEVELGPAEIEKLESAYVPHPVLGHDQPTPRRPRTKRGQP